MFGNIVGIEADDAGLFYVLDNAFKTIRKFSFEGELLGEFTLLNGEGPGEFRDPISIALSGDHKHLYVSDLGQLRVSVLDTDFSFVGSFRPASIYTMLRAGPEATIVATYAQFNTGTSSSLINVFQEDGQIVGAFGERHEDFMYYHQKKIQGYSNVFVDTYGTKLCLSYGYPYEIRVLNLPTGFVQSRFTRRVDFYGGEISRGRFTLLTGRSSGICYLTDNLILHFIRNNTSNQTYLQAFDEDGMSRGEYNLSELGIGEIPAIVTVAGARQRLLFLAVNRPYPGIELLTVKSATGVVDIRPE